MILPALLLLAQAAPAVPAGEDPVAPYRQSNANAGATPFTGTAMLRAFHGREGIGRVVDGFVQRNESDPRIADIFRNQDLVRLRRMLKEQFCYLLNGGCDYTGRDMSAAHKDMGVQTADFDAVVENLQASMRAEHVPFFAQDRFLAKLAPMHRKVIRQ